MPKLKTHRNAVTNSLMQLLQHHSDPSQPAASETIDDVTLEYCVSVAEQTDAQDTSEIQNLTDLFNQLLMPNIKNSSSNNNDSQLSPTAVQLWLRDLHTAETGVNPAVTSKPAVHVTDSTEPLIAVSSTSAVASTTPIQPTGRERTVPCSLTLNPTAAVFVPQFSHAAANQTQAEMASMVETAGVQDAAIVKDSAALDNAYNVSSYPGVQGPLSESQHTVDDYQQRQGSEHSNAWSDTQQGEAGYGDTYDANLAQGWATDNNEPGFWGYEGYPNSTEMYQDVEDPLEFLSLMFPSYDQDMLQQLLEAYQGDVNACMQELVFMQQDSRQASWVYQACHSEDETGKATTSQRGGTQLESSLQLNDQESFPELTAAPSTSSTSQSKHVTGQVLSNNAWHADMGGWAHIASRPAPKRDATTLTTNNHHASATASTVGVKQSPGKSSSYSPSNHRGANNASTSQGLWTGSSGVVVPRVATGSKLREQYAQARQEASAWARARNMCFQQATMAYLSGNKALAKELSRKGRQHADKMFAAHDQAAQHIMNTRAAVQQAPGGPLLLDLHGLHVQEAIAVLQQYTVKSSALAAKGGILHVVVGVGKHSKETVAAPRLLTAIMAHLKASGLQHQVLKPGLIEVQL